MLFHKDNAGHFEDTSVLGWNPAFEERVRPTKDGGMNTLEGSLYLDFAFEPF